MVVGPDSLLEAGPSTSTPASVKKKHVEVGGQGSTPKNGSGSKKRASVRPDDPNLASKRRRSAINGYNPATSSSVRPNNLDKEKVIIVISDSEEDDTIPISRSRQRRRVPSPTFVGSDSDSDSESESDIRSVSPPIITLPSRSFALPPPDSPFRGTIPSPVRLSFQKPIDDTPTDSESEDEDRNPSSGMGMGINTFSTIGLTTNEDLVNVYGS